VGKSNGKKTNRRPGLGGSIILNWILGRYEWGGMEWIDMGQDKKLWRALVDTENNLQVP
jgi:hypothetical protein